MKPKRPMPWMMQLTRTYDFWTYGDGEHRAEAVALPPDCLGPVTVKRVDMPGLNFLPTRKDVTSVQWGLLGTNDEMLVVETPEQVAKEYRRARREQTREGY
jgi:hypothetical protein